jgi:hypothetical protein
LQAVVEAQISEPVQGFVVVGNTHVPEPLQVCGPVIAALMQAGGPHIVPLATNRQAPLPSQVPSVPQASVEFVQRPFELPPFWIGLQRPLDCPVSVLEQD